MAHKLQYVAAEQDPLVSARAPQSISANAERDGRASWIRNIPRIIEPWTGRFDTALCVNQLESAEDPVEVMRIAAPTV